MKNTLYIVAWARGTQVEGNASTITSTHMATSLIDPASLHKYRMGSIQLNGDHATRKIDNVTGVPEYVAWPAFLATDPPLIFFRAVGRAEANWA